MITVSVTADLPIGTVFEYFTDFRNENEWNVVAHDIRKLTPGPIGVGSRFGGDYDRMGPMEYEITEYREPTWAAVRGTAKRFTWDSTFTFSEEGSGTRVVCTMEPNPRGLLKVVKPLMSGVIRKQMLTGLGSLTRTLEAKAAS
jgi:polyketide cyclase/dehydrase/lipid transport protein